MTVETVFGRRQSSSTVFERVYPARLATGLVVATGIHAMLIVAAYLLALGPAGGDFPIQRPVNLGPRPNLIPKVAPAPEVTPKAQKAVPELFNPVAVPDAQADPEQTLPTQTEASSGTDVKGEAGAGDAGTVAAGGEAGAGDAGEGLENAAYTFVENPPVPIHQVTPEYPALAKLTGTEGTVYLSLLVDREGKVTKVRVVRSDKDIFNDNAIEAARQWIFRPGETGGGTVAVWVSVPFRFRIRE